MKTIMWFLSLLTCCLLGCRQSDSISQDVIDTQTAELRVDAKNYVFSQEDLISLNYAEQTHFLLTILSQRDDLSLSIQAFMPELKPGAYQVWDCYGDSDCTKEEDDMNQSTVVGPYPSVPMAPLNEFRTAYKSTNLGLKPLTLTITSVTDEQRAGVIFKTKRVKGHLSGTLAYVEKLPNRSWKIVGKTTTIDGKFDMFCSVL